LFLTAARLRQLNQHEQHVEPQFLTRIQSEAEDACKLQATGIDRRSMQLNGGVMHQRHDGTHRGARTMGEFAINRFSSMFGMDDASSASDIQAVRRGNATRCGRRSRVEEISDMLGRRAQNRCE
jgi:hypothetical protein